MTLHPVPPRDALADPGRLAALDAFAILDTPPEQGFDDIVLLATRACACPVALVSLVDRDRQWFKARVGFEPCETDIERSVCRHALAQADLLVIPDLTADPRTRDNPLVTGEPHLRFYAGAPLVVAGGVIGTLCVIDAASRPDGLTEEQASSLKALARQVVSQLELRRTLTERDIAVTDERRGRAQAVADAGRLEAMIATQQVVASATADLDAVFQAIVEGGLSVVDAAAGAIVEIREGDELVYRTAAGASAERTGYRMPIAGTLSGRALTDERPVVCADTQTEPGTDHALARDLGIRSMVAVPIQRLGVAIGVLKLQSDRPDAFSPRDVLMTQMLAGLASSGFGEVAEAQTRRALRDAESRYKAIFDSAVDFAIVAADAGGRITDWNAGAERIMGWSPDEVRGRELDVFFTPEDRAAGQPQHEESTVRAVGSATDVRWHQRKGGERFWALGRMMALRHEDDSVRGYLKILQDRTREKRREQRVLLIAGASEALLSADDPAAALMPVLTEGAEALGFDQNFTWDIDPDGAHLLLTHSVGVDEAAQEALRRVSFDVPLCGIVAETGRALVLSSLQAGDEPRYAIARDAGIDAYASYPVTSRGRVAGAISFATCDEPAFDDEALSFFATVARFLSIARDRRDAAVALAASERRLRLAQAAGGVGAFEVDVPASTVTVTPEFCALFGLPQAEAYPAAALEALALAEDADAVSSDASRRDGTAPLATEYRIHRADDGRVRWIARVAELVRGPDGAVARMLGTAQDVTERKQAQARQAALLVLGDRLRDLDDVGMITAVAAEVAGTTLDLSRAGYCAVDAERETVEVERDWAMPGLESIAGPHHFRTYGSYVEQLKRGETVLVGDVLDDPRTADTAAALVGVGGRALFNLPLMERGRFVGLFFALCGRPRAWDEDEVRFLRSVADRTRAAIARAEAEARQDLLNHELSHRMKNLLAMVQSIAAQTMRAASAVEEARDVLGGRLIALGKAHDLLMGGALAGTRICDVVREALAVHGAGGGRFRLSGPDEGIGADQALSLSLMLHELATNAAKYGALSNDAGHVEVAWQRLPGGLDGAGPLLRLSWREVGGPPVTPPTRKGFGSRFIQRALATQVGGELSLDYPPEGVVCTLTAPVAAFGATREAPARPQG